jgi:hypothetical protein
MSTSSHVYSLTESVETSARMCQDGAFRMTWVQKDSSHCDDQNVNINVKVSNNV